MIAILTPTCCECVDGMFVLKTEAQTKPYGSCVSINATPDRSGVKSIVVWKEGSGQAAAVCICDGRHAQHPRRPEMDAAYCRAVEAAKEEDLEVASEILASALADPNNDWPADLVLAIEMALLREQTATPTTSTPTRRHHTR